jgi:hypothetical protein
MNSSSAREPPQLIVVLDAPQPVVKVPLGEYDTCQVSLKQGQTEAYQTGPQRLGSLTVRTNALSPAVLLAGGPLTNVVTVANRGASFELVYQLQGMGGETYQLKGERKQPEFAVYHAGKKIGSGKFEFG